MCLWRKEGGQESKQKNGDEKTRFFTEVHRVRMGFRRFLVFSDVPGSNCVSRVSPMTFFRRQRFFRRCSNCPNLGLRLGLFLANISDDVFEETTFFSGIQ